MSLQDMIQQIANKDDLAKFICELRADLKNNSDTWENTSLEDYLEAMQSWTEDIEGWEKNCDIDFSHMTPWQLIAHVLFASKMYE